MKTTIKRNVVATVDVEVEVVTLKKVSPTTSLGVCNLRCDGCREILGTARPIGLAYIQFADGKKQSVRLCNGCLAKMEEASE